MIREYNSVVFKFHPTFNLDRYDLPKVSLRRKIQSHYIETWSNCKGDTAIFKRGSQPKRRGVFPTICPYSNASIV